MMSGRETRFALLLITFSTTSVALAEMTIHSPPTPRVVTPITTFLGSAHRTQRRDQEYFAFTGIPYAQAPIGHLRFKPPQPRTEFEHEFSATHHPHECIQWDNLLGRGVVGHEDCLYLNIYTNRIPEAPLFLNTQPIVALLHAGTWGAGAGASDLFSPDYLLEMSVMVITINHRLGPFGFLTTESHDAVGNMGLLDQVRALEWVRDFSRYFGGMNDSVTVMGSGAGGISTHLLTLSPKAHGASNDADQHALFHYAISQSGTGYSPHAIVREPLEKAKMLAKKLKCKVSSPNSIVSCLAVMPAAKIIQAIPTLHVWDEEPPLFGPVIDRKWMGDEAVIPDEVHHMIKHHQMLRVPWMVGSNQNDGAFRVQDILKDPALVHQLNMNWDKYGPLLLHLDKYSCKDPIQMANRIRDFYMGKSLFGEGSAPKFIEMMTDRFFLYPTERASQDHSLNLRKFKQYCYRYHLTYCGDKSFLDILHEINPNEISDSAFVAKGLNNPRFQGKMNNALGFGVSFLDELLYLFPSKKLNLIYDLNFSNNNAAQVSSFMLILWSNFAKGGDPTPTLEGASDDFSPWGMWWEPYVKGTHYYLQIDPEMETREEDLKPKQMAFWKSLPLYENVDQNVIRDEL